MKIRRLGGLLASCAVLGVALALPGQPSTSVPHRAPALALADCTLKPGTPITAPPWPDDRLGFRRVWPITQGGGVRVAVIDSGFAPNVAQLKGIAYSDVQTVIKDGYSTFDCANHGTGVTAIIAGQSAGTPFSGVAPKATIIPIKMSSAEKNPDGAAALAAAIRAAVAAKARVANLSVSVDIPDAGVRAAVEYAQAHDLILVCSGGNDGMQNNQPTYPAAWSSSYDNVIAVSAIDQDDSVGTFSESGKYITLAAPGSSVVTPYSGGGFGKQDGTSFAAPYVTGTVALVLGAHPGLTPGEVRQRLEATADPPPAAVPDQKYGYGIVNPYLAVTAARTDTVTAAPSAVAAPLPPLPPIKPADHHLQHLALGVGAGLLGLAIVVAVGAAVLRSSRRAPRPARSS